MFYPIQSRKCYFTFSYRSHNTCPSFKPFTNNVLFFRVSDFFSSQFSYLFFFTISYTRHTPMDCADKVSLSKNLSIGLAELLAQHDGVLWVLKRPRRCSHAIYPLTFSDKFVSIIKCDSETMRALNRRKRTTLIDPL